METDFKIYDNLPIVTFKQIFPDGVTNTSLGDPMQTISIFPSFSANPNLNFMSFQDLWDLGTINNSKIYTPQFTFKSIQMEHLGNIVVA